MKQPVKDLAASAVEVIDLKASVLGMTRPRTSGHYSPNQTVADLIALAGPDTSVTQRMMFQELEDVTDCCLQYEIMEISHQGCLATPSSYERTAVLEDYQVEWDPDLRF